MDPAGRQRRSWEKQERLSIRMGSRPLRWNSSGLLLFLLLLLGSEVLGRPVGEDAAVGPEGQAVSSMAAEKLSVARRRSRKSVSVKIAEKHSERHSQSNPHRSQSEWSYEQSAQSTSGVYSWAKLFPTCGGSSQSPIDLLTSKTTYDPSLESFTFRSFDTDVGWTITNDGHTVQADCTTDKLLVSGGSLGAAFQVKQFHWHWGSNNSRGSEHTVNSRAYPMEIHIVCLNIKYNDMETAMSKPDGLAVLGILYEISDKKKNKQNSALQNIVNVLHSVKEPGTSVRLKVALKDLMGPTDRYYRYKGSLTTPTCNEIAIWTVFKDPIPVSPSQMSEFRQLIDSHAHSLADNFRPVQDLHGRPLTANFQDHADGRQRGQQQLGIKVHLLHKEAETAASPAPNSRGGSRTSTVPNSQSSTAAPDAGMILDTDEGIDDEVKLTMFEKATPDDNNKCVCP